MTNNFDKIAEITNRYMQPRIEAMGEQVRRQMYLATHLRCQVCSVEFKSGYDGARIWSPALRNGLCPLHTPIKVSSDDDEALTNNTR
jgi:hypothetical protein